MNKFSIGDITNLTGISTHSIRKWEERYQLAISKRTESNIRCYDTNDLCYFLNISALLKSGYKISAVAKMDQAAITEAINQLAGIANDANLPETNLINATLQLNHYNLSNALDYLVERDGLLKAMSTVIFPFMVKVGWMWQLGTLNTAHEHFASNIIRQKIITATNNLSDKTNSNGKRFMLFLPPRENHDLGLLIAQYILKSRGHHVLYLGQDMPYEYLYETAVYYQPDYVVSALTQSFDEAPNQVVTKILYHLPHWPLVLSGALAINTIITPNDRLKIVKTIEEFEGMW